LQADIKVFTANHGWWQRIHFNDVIKAFHFERRKIQRHIFLLAGVINQANVGHTALHFTNHSVQSFPSHQLHLFVVDDPQPMTFSQLRARIEAGDATLPKDEWGGCGCGSDIEGIVSPPASELPSVTPSVAATRVEAT